jgi:hypothetical protein
VPSYSSQPSISAYPQDFDDQHCANVVKLLNFFPTKGGVSETFSPKTIMSGETLSYKKHLSLQIDSIARYTRRTTRATVRLLEPGHFLDRAEITGRFQVHGFEHRQEDCSTQLDHYSHVNTVTLV